MRTAILKFVSISFGALTVALTAALVGIDAGHGNNMAILIGCSLESFTIGLFIGTLVESLRDRR
jgi:hypothetical protein